MKLGAFLIPPSLDAKQALRLRRFGLASLIYGLAIPLLALAWVFDMLPAAAALEALVAFVAINLGLYWLIRSGLNLRFQDPSLTGPQILLAVTILMYIVYHMEAGRSIGLFGCFIIFLFGVFRLSGREFRLVTLYTLAAYALVVDLLMYLRPQSIHEVPLEWMSWLILAALLPGFTIVGTQINALRRRLHESERRFRGLAEMSSDFYWESDTEHRLTLLGSGGSASGVPALRQAPQIGQRRWEIPYLSPDATSWRAHRELLDARRPFRNFELSRLGADGAECHISISGDPEFNESGAFKGYRGVGTDVSARRRAEQALRRSMEDLRLFSDNIPVMTASIDETLHYRFANKAFAAFFGFSVEDLVGRHVREVIGEQAYQEVQIHFVEVLQGHAAMYRRKIELPDRDPRYLEVKLLPHIVEQGRILGCFTVTTDITEHQRSEDRMQRMAHHDSLTGLPNRLLFNDRLNQAINLARRDSRQFALLYVDLDRFKSVNDTLGHAAGDALLQGVGTRMRQLVRESDTVARVGGDEFSMILADIGKREDAEIVARKLIAALSSPFELGEMGQTAQIGASVGIAIYPADGADADALSGGADTAMYAAKQVGCGFRFRSH